MLFSTTSLGCEERNSCISAARGRAASQLLRAALWAWKDLITVHWVIMVFAVDLGGIHRIDGCTVR